MILKIKISLFAAFCLHTLTSQHVCAQHREIGLISTASMGLLYGPVLDARPVIKWGQTMDNVRTIRAEQTYLNFSRFQGNDYGSASSGIYFGQEWRKLLNDRLYFVHGPEIGSYLTFTGAYTAIQPGIRYSFGVFYKLNDKVNFALTTPITMMTSFGISDGNWEQSAFSLGVFSENNHLIVTYSLENKEK
tara:strand:+ start:156 stop:725 length:570 start_codon:yes stop_codon:yes gene_type:complete